MPASPSRPTLGLALGGGGARGLAHVGVLKALAEAGIYADVVAGASMGGLIGAAYAMGYPARAIESEVLGLSRHSQILKLADRMPTLQAFFTGKRFETYLNGVIGADRTFADLRRPLALAASDLRTGREVVLRSGSVVTAMRASMSIPGIFAPVEIGGYRLADGGILNNVPADLARDLGANVVLAVDVLPYFRENRLDEPPRVEPVQLPLMPPGVSDVWQAMFVAISALTECNLNRAKPDLVVRPALPADVTLIAGFTRADLLIRAGEQAMSAMLPELRDVMKRAAAPADTKD